MHPIAEWNAELQQCRLDVEMKRKWEARLHNLQSEVERQQRRANECLQTLQTEEKDVEQLTASSFSQFWLGLVGKLDDTLQKEQKEAAEGKLKYDAAQAALQALQKEVADVTGQLGRVADADDRLARLMSNKETWIREHDSAESRQLEQLSQQIGSSGARLAETEEARHAGLAAKQALAGAEDRLSSARNWGTYDMLGGGMIATMVKHGRIDEAEDHIHDAQHHLRRFAEELKDLNWQIDNAAPQIGGFLGFSDYFFDGLIADWMVQGRINDSLESIRSHSTQVDGLLRRLEQERRRLESESAGLSTQYNQTIQRYQAEVE
jgi:hypothetical protein